MPLFAGHVLQSFDCQLVFAAGEVMVQRTLWRATAWQDLVKSGGMESLRTEQFGGRVEKPRASFSSFGGSFHLFSQRLRRLTNRPVYIRLIYHNYYGDCNTRAGNTQIVWTIWRLGFTSDHLLVGDALAQAPRHALRPGESLIAQSPWPRSMIGRSSGYEFGTQLTRRRGPKRAPTSTSCAC